MSSENYNSANLLRDYCIVSATAFDAIYQAMLDGQKHGYGDDWRTSVSLKEHVDHAEGHALEAQAIVAFESNFELREELTHAICRLAMALWHLDNEEEEESV